MQIPGSRARIFFIDDEIGALSSICNHNNLQMLSVTKILFLKDCAWRLFCFTVTRYNCFIF